MIAEERQRAQQVTPLRILLADDDAMICDDFAELLSLEPGVEIVGTARNGAEVLLMLEESHPDVILLDVDMPVMDGVQVLTVLMERGCLVPVIMLTAYGERELVERALAAGARGYLSKGASPALIVAALRNAVDGAVILSPESSDAVFRGDVRTSGRQDDVERFLVRLADVPDRFLPVLTLLARGRSNAEIARQTCLSEATVRTYVTGLLERFDCASRTELAVVAVRAGLG